MTRLETRTKESNMYASLMVINQRAKRKRNTSIKGLYTPQQYWPVFLRGYRVRAYMMGPERE